AGGELDRGAADLADHQRSERLQLGPVAAEDEAAGALAEERLLGRAAALAQVLQVGAATEAGGDRRRGPRARRRAPARRRRRPRRRRAPAAPPPARPAASPTPTRAGWGRTGRAGRSRRPPWRSPSARCAPDLTVRRP